MGLRLGPGIELGLELILILGTGGLSAAHSGHASECSGVQARVTQRPLASSECEPHDGYVRSIRGGI